MATTTIAPAERKRKLAEYVQLDALEHVILELDADYVVSDDLLPLVDWDRAKTLLATDLARDLGWLDRDTNIGVDELEYSLASIRSMLFAAQIFTRIADRSDAWRDAAAESRRLAEAHAADLVRESPDVLPAVLEAFGEVPTAPGTEGDDDA